MTESVNAAAVAASGRKIPLKVSVIGIDGQLRS